MTEEHQEQQQMSKLSLQDRLSALVKVFQTHHRQLDLFNISRVSSFSIHNSTGGVVMSAWWQMLFYTSCLYYRYIHTRAITSEPMRDH